MNISLAGEIFVVWGIESIISAIRDRCDLALAARVSVYRCGFSCVSFYHSQRG